MLFKPIETIKSMLDQVIVKPGQMIYCTDTGETFFDSSEDGRVSFSDIIFLYTEDARLALIAPLDNKIYFIRSTSTMYTYSETNGWSNLKTLASKVYDSNGNTIEDRVNSITTSKIGMTVKDVVATEDYQKTFTIPFPFTDYLSGGNQLIVQIGASWLNPVRYTISGDQLILGSIETGLEIGRSLSFIFLYNSAAVTPCTNLDGSYITNGSLGIEKVKPTFFDNVIIKTYSSKIIPGANASTIAINIPQYDSTKDSLRVYMDRMRLFADDDFSILGSNINLIGIATTASTKFVFEVDKIIKV